SLQMCISGHDDMNIFLGYFNDGVLQFFYRLNDDLDLLFYIEMHIRSNLIISAASCVELASYRTDQFYQCMLHIHMNILMLHIPFDVAFFNFLFYTVKSVDYRILVFR